MTYVVGRPRLFAGFRAYDDEGYLLTVLKSFIEHGALYDQVFSQYGPFYYEFWGLTFRLLGIPVDHDTGRMFSLLVWVVVSASIGAVTMRMTRSLLLGVAVQLLAFSALAVFQNEPMHPGGLICLLLVAALGFSCLVRDDRPSPAPVAALGGTLACLTLVKVNVGFFALAALALACVVSYPALIERRWLRWGVRAGFVAVPVVLMLRELDQEWVRRYALHVGFGALALVIALKERPSFRRPNTELASLVAGVVVGALLICAVIIALGTSPDGLLEGVIRQPLRQSSAFTVALGLESGVFVLDVIALAAAVAYRFVNISSPVTVIAISFGTIIVGFLVMWSVGGRSFVFAGDGPIGYPFAMLGFCWVALIEPVPFDRNGASFARLLLPPLALLQSLHAFPVAGSQMAWSSFLLLPVGAVCIGNGVRALAVITRREPFRRPLALVASALAIVFVLAIVDSSLRRPFQNYRAAFRAAVPADLPGASRLRLAPDQAKRFRTIANALSRRCPAVIMLPGMDSFYLWAEQEPPTTLNATAWPTLFDDALQRRVVEETRSIKGLCLLENERLARSWNRGPTPDGPLVAFLRQGFDPIETFGGYRLSQRTGAPRLR